MDALPERVFPGPTANQAKKQVEALDASEV